MRFFDDSSFFRRHSTVVLPSRYLKEEPVALVRKIGYATVTDVILPIKLAPLMVGHSKTLVWRCFYGLFCQSPFELVRRGGGRARASVVTVKRGPGICTLIVIDEFRYLL